MKFCVVLAWVAAMICLGVGAGFCRWLMRPVALLIPLQMALWTSSAVMLFSAELYRGTTRGMEVSLAYLLAFAMTVALAMRRRGGRLLPDRGAVFFLLYWLLSLPSLANCHSGAVGGHAHAGLLFAWFEIWKVAMMFLVYRAVRGYCCMTDDADTPLVGLGIVAVVNFLVVVRQHFFDHVAQARGLFAHQNSMAMWTLMAAGLFLSAYLNGGSGKKRIFYACCLFASVVGCVRTYSRGALVCLPISAAVVVAVSLSRNFSLRLLRRLVPLALVGLAGIALALPSVCHRFAHASVRSGEKRVGLAWSAVNMVRDHPWAGVGLNNWGVKINPPYDYAVHRRQFGFSDDFKDGVVETIYLLVWAECGTPCLLALLALFFWHWWKAFRLTGRLRGQPNFWIAAGAFGGLSGLYLQSMLEWVLKQSINFTELVIVFALISYLNEKADADDRERKRKEALTNAK